ncbi:MAG: DNA polymerase III subunit alpha [Candidatus Peregrinibacteria bacterium]|nr:DNA polymerase III subunit alpha [Candidatus Peregrinibacteria bacterium]MDZ4245032.1 DNA polymerase III subunit alpha [Candidatus Gracilibacteria bacterium]
MSFVHLHAHTHYSFLDALAKPKEYAEICGKYEMPACAITDHGGLYGAIEFYQKMEAKSIKPIIGVDAYIASHGHTDKSPDNKRYRMVLIALNDQGYKNLMRLVSISHLDGFYYKPRMDDELLKKYSEGILALSGDMWGEVGSKILNNDYIGAKNAIERYQLIFGKENFYLELQHRPEISSYGVLRENVIKLSEETGAGIVATNACRYATMDDAYAHDAFVCIGSQKTVDQEDRMKYDGNYSIASPEYMKEAFKDLPEAIENTLKIAERCDVKIVFGKTYLPSFDTPSGKSPDDYLKELCETGLKAKYDEDQLKEASERLTYELSVLKDMGFATYFLIVNDFVQEAKRRNIPVGPGRGSAAGSIISFTLGITTIEPLRYGLLFERFLNPQRAAMPDIDIDFADNRRDEVLQYVIDKYGDDHVAQIITFGTLAPRAAVRDAGRVLGYSYAEVDQLSKKIPAPILGKHRPLKESVDNDPELSKAYKENLDSKKILDIALKFENTVRHVSTHACAVVISDREITNYAPLQRAIGGKEGSITQYEMNAVADIGLLKMDFLGLRNLTILKTTVDIIKRTRKKDIDLDNLPVDDKKTYKLMADGKTTGIFQFESPGMKRYLKELKPTELDDLIAMNSLYRPGPMEYIPQFIKGKHDPKSVKYLDKSLEPILKKTHGVAVYQEQIMQLAQELAGMSLGDAYILLKAIGKKKASIMKKMRKQFTDGVVAKGHTEKFANEAFEKVIEPFAGYGFNKSHAACYSWIAYQTAYLKAHYPAEFMAALLSSDPDNTEKVVIGINECEAMGITVLPPHINTSLAHFTVIDEHTIGFGLTAIKGLGEATARELIKVRGDIPFEGIEDFARRVPYKLLNKKSLEALIYPGALDIFGERNALSATIEEVAKFARTVQEQADSGQTDIFGLMTEDEGWEPTFHLKDTEPATEFEKLQYEKKYLGLYVTRHPLDGLKKYLSKKVTLAEKFNMKLKGKHFKIGGLVTEVRKIMTKAGKYMMYIQLEDPTAKFEVVVFPNSYPELSKFIREDAVVVLDGKLEHRGKFQFVAENGREVGLERMIEAAKKQGFYDEKDRVRFVDEILPDENEVVDTGNEDTEVVADVDTIAAYVIEVPKGAKVDVLESLKVLLKEHKGDMPVEIKLPIPKSHKKTDVIKVPFGVHVDDELKKKIAELLPVI